MPRRQRNFVVVAREIVIESKVFSQGDQIAHDQLGGRAARLVQMGLIRELAPDDEDGSSEQQ